MGTSASRLLPGDAPHPSFGFCLCKYEVIRRLERGLLDFQEAVNTSALTTSTAEVLSTRAQCKALAQEFRVGVTEIDGLVEVILQLLTEVDSDQLCGEAVVMPVELLLASLEEIWRCVVLGTDFIAKCNRLEVPGPGADPTLSTSWAVTLFQMYSYFRTLMEVGFYRFLIELRRLGVLESPVGWNISEDVADEFCNAAPFDLFEWCIRSCRPVLKQLHLELGEQVMQHPHPGMDHLWLQLREARAERARCSLWTQVQDEPSAKPSDSLPLRVNFEDVKIVRHLGQGSFGSVFQCKWHDQDIAMKIIPMDVASSVHQEKFESEVSILWSLRHPNIVRTFGYGFDPQGSGSGFIMMERMEASLDTLIRDLRRYGGSHVFPLDVSMDLMSQILEGMCALRVGRVIHRDLKPGNILVNRLDNGMGPSERMYEVKLADFGTSKQHGVDTSICTTEKVGTAAYMAPEVNCAAVIGKQGYSWEADVYSFGMVCSEILTGERPFDHLECVTCSTVLSAVRRGERPKLLLGREDPLRALIEDCWKLQPNGRPDVWEIRRRLSQCRLRFHFMAQTPPMSNLLKDLEINFKNRCQEALRSWAEKDKFTSWLKRNVNQSLAFKGAVYDWERSYSVFHAFKGAVYDWERSYSVFQVVLFTSVAHCNSTWIASLLSSLAFFVTVIGVILKLRSIKGLKDTISGEEAARRIWVAWRLSLREEGEKFKFDSVRTSGQQEDSLRDIRSARWLIISFAVVVVALILFSVAFVVSIPLILGAPRLDPYLLNYNNHSLHCANIVYYQSIHAHTQL